MAPHFQFDETSHEVARIKILGVGGGGGNAVDYMIEQGLNSVEYISLNTDRQALARNRSDVKIQVGSHLTGGLGAGARPEIGREAVEESRNQIEEAVEGADMVFITAGMGGGTGTGGAPVIAGIARRKGILTVGIVTTPFHYEGKVRMQYALEGINEMRMNCDTLIVIPNERLLELSDETTSMVSAFAMANNVLYNATKGISDLVILPGLINLDFADVRTTMTNGGAAIMGSASASGAERAEVAAMEAIHSPLLDGVSMRGARNVLVNISSDESLGMHETMIATRIIQQEAGDDAEIIIGTVLDPANEDHLRVTVIATGFELEDGSTQIRLAPADRSGAHPAKLPLQGLSGAGQGQPGFGAGRLTGLSGGAARAAGTGESGGPMKRSGGGHVPTGFQSPYSGNAGHAPLHGAHPAGGDWSEHASGDPSHRSGGTGAPRNGQGPHTDPMQMDERLESSSNDFYKGERNLKTLDTPAIQRRQIQHNTGQRYADEDHSLSGGRPEARPDDTGAAARGFGSADPPRPRLSVIPGTTGGQGDSWGSRQADFDADEHPASPPAWKRTVNSPELGRNSSPAEGAEHDPRAYGAPRDMAPGTPGAAGSQPAGTTRENRPNDWQEKQKIDKSHPDQPAFLRKIMD